MSLVAFSRLLLVFRSLSHALWFDNGPSLVGSLRHTLHRNDNSSMIHEVMCSETIQGRQVVCRGGVCDVGKSYRIIRDDCIIIIVRRRVV